MWLLVFVVSFLGTALSFGAAIARGDALALPFNSRSSMCDTAIAEAGLEPAEVTKYRTESEPFFGQDRLVCSFRYFENDVAQPWQQVVVGSELSSNLVTLGSGFLGMTFMSLAAVILFAVVGSLKFSPPHWVIAGMSGIALVSGIGLSIFYMYWS